MKTIIHVNQHHIKHNRKTGDHKPVLTVKDYKKTRYGTNVAILGPSVLVYRPNAPLACGAHVWIETYADVQIINEEVRS